MPRCATSRSATTGPLQSLTGEATIVAEVVGIAPVDAHWQVRTADGTTWLTPNLIVSTGPDLVPVRPRWPGEEIFTGTIIHAAEFDNLAS